MCLFTYICLKKVMVQAYTLSDRIVQQSFNDVQTAVGMVFKRPDGLPIEVSSMDALRAANAQQLSYGQASAYYVDTTELYCTANVSKDIVEGSYNSTLLLNLFNGQSFISGGSDQWAQIRRLETTPVLNGTAISGIMYKIVADVFLSTPTP